MPATKKQEEEIKKWFIQEFWPRYGGKHIEARQKGPRGQALKIMVKINPDEKERDRILANMIAQLRADDQDAKAGKFVARWAMCTTYLNQRRYDDEIESRLYDDDEKPDHTLATCCVAGCEEEVHGPRFNHCESHMPEEKEHPVLKAMRKKYSELGLKRKPEESTHDHAMRCRMVYMDAINGVTKEVPA